MITEILVYFFTLVIVVPVMYILFTKNVIRAVFSLAFSFLGFAGLYVLMNAEFMAVVQLLIYAGGIIVLMIFGLMLTKTTFSKGFVTKHRSFYAGLLVAVVLFGALMMMAGESNFNTGEVTNRADPIGMIGVAYLTDFIIVFEVVAFLLLLALVGAAFLAQKSGEE